MRIWNILFQIITFVVFKIASNRSRSDRPEKSSEKQTAIESGGVQTFAIDADEPLDSDSDDEDAELSRKACFVFFLIK